jgi:excinuclease UvrABC ATPase subunit
MFEIFKSNKLSYKDLKWIAEFWEQEANRLRKDQENHWKEHHEQSINNYKSEMKRKDERIKMLLDHIKKISTCKTCMGNPDKTWGMVPCGECGLIGNCPWPG